jgi:general secretion pathway protein J
MQLAFAQLQSDCEHIVGEEVMLKRPFLLGTNDRITLVRTVFAENEPSRLQVVSYRIINGALTRRESIATRDLGQLDIMWQAAVSDTDPTPPVALEAGVVKMAVMTWQNNAWHQGTAPTTTNTNPNPNAPSPMPITGLQVALSVDRLELPMTKSFLLGGP